MIERTSDVDHGHGPHVRGRSLSPQEHTREAMRALLELGGVRAMEGRTPLSHGTLFHLEAGSGAPLVLLQGAGGGAANWYRLMGPLAETRHVLAPELPGYGLSDALPASAPLAEQAARVMAEWLDARVGDESIDLIATSFGGQVALRLALLRPARVRRMALLNATGLGRGLALPVRFAGLPVIRGLLKNPSRAGTATLFGALLVADPARLPPGHADAIVEYTWRCAVSCDGHGLADTLGLFCGVRGQRNTIAPDELARIEAPVLILWGSADRFLPPRHGLRAASFLPHAEFRLLDNVGHSPNWEAPDAVLTHVRPFLGIA